MRNGVFARAGRQAARDLDPFDELADGKICDFDQTISDLFDIRLATRVHPDDRVPKRVPIPVHGDGPRPLTGGCDGVNVFSWNKFFRKQAFDGGVDRVPPFRWRLFRAAILEQQYAVLLKLTADQFPLQRK